jgi:starch phosphorylase
MDITKRNRSCTGPNEHATWKPTPEIAKRWLELTKSTQLDELHIQKAFVYHVSKTLARSAFNMFNILTKGTTLQPTRRALTLCEMP